ncbi:unnamed protein product [Haemonchus placei]|uniref:Uncharacterized protein n=1 Tax=Haemonchus placei TaxID=6290 RepID=A0A0N4WYC6_HAEPC|nr:unnamed protein product [Haemonchus placei]
MDLPRAIKAQFSMGVYHRLKIYRHGGADVNMLNMLTRGNMTDAPRNDPICINTPHQNSLLSLRFPWFSNDANTTRRYECRPAAVRALTI